MKKTLLALFCVSLLGVSPASAALQSFQIGNGMNHIAIPNSSISFKNENAKSNNFALLAPQKETAEPSMNWGYCYSPYTAYSLPAGDLGGAIMVTKEMATEWAGAVISAVQVGNPTNQSYANPLKGKDLKVWIAESLEDEPVCNGVGPFGSNGFEYTSVNLDESYTIKADTPFYIGYNFTLTQLQAKSTYCVIVDGMQPMNDYSAYIYSTVTGYDPNQGWTTEETPTWKPMGDLFTNICLTATISGDMLPTDAVTIMGGTIPPTVSLNQDFDLTVYVANVGANTVTSFDLTLDIEGMESQVKHIQLSKDQVMTAYHDAIAENASFVCSQVGANVPFNIYISAVNDTPVNNPQILTGGLLCLEKGYKRNIVIEEATGTWCGWCVRGYVGMEYMKENYADKGFIGIALHQGDPMDVFDGAYAPYANLAGGGGFPNSFVNRNWSNNIDPDPKNLEAEFLYNVNIPGLAQINAELVAEGNEAKNVKLNTKTTFLFDAENANYGIAYTVVEDNVGPYVQQNYYSGGSAGEFYGYENMGRSIPLTYNDVARNCSHPEPFKNSVPSSIKAENEYEYSMNITLDDVTDLNNYRIVAMLIDNTTGLIVNACEVSPAEPTGVSEIYNTSDLKVIGAKGMLTVNGENANVYSADGRMVASNVNGNVTLPAGLYIVANGKKTVKVIVR